MNMKKDLSSKYLRQIAEFVGRLSDVAKKEKWVSRYDPEDDSLSFHRPRLSRLARKKYINDEFAFYFGPKARIEGVFIEYFGANFVSHHQAVRDVLTKKDLKPRKSDGIIEFSSSKTSRVASELKIAMIESILAEKREVGAR